MLFLISSSENLASFLHLRPVKRVTLPVLVNLLFSGFSGYGNQLVSLTEEQFEPWFGHVEHRIPHLIVPVGEEQTTTLRYPTQDSKIFYGFHLNLIKLSPMFNTITQDQILWNLRPETPHTRYRQTDNAADEVLVEVEETEEEATSTHYVDANHMSAFLQAAAKGLGIEHAYNLFLLNPSSSVKANQVYGYREGFSQPEIDELVQVWGRDMEDLDSLYELLDVDPEPCLAEEPPALPEFLLPLSDSDRVNVVDYTAASTEWASWFMKQQHEASERVNQMSEGPDDPRDLFRFAKGEAKSVIELAERILVEGTEYEKEYLLRLLLQSEDLPTANCLTDNWVTTGRTMFLDLTAGPFSWGPLIASEGTRTHQTVPEVPEYEQVHHDMDKEHAGQIHDMVLGKLRNIRQLYSMKCSDQAAQTTALCRQYSKELHNWEERYRVLREHIAQEEEVEGSEEEGEDADWVMENFLSRLSALIAQTLRQVIVPGAPLYDTPYSRRIVYHMYFISSHNNYPLTGPQGFDFEEFQEELSLLKFASQDVSFIAHELSMSDSPELTTAFQDAQRSVVMSTLSADGVYGRHDVHYVDSMKLRDSLRALHQFNIHGHYPGADRHIPILFFSVDQEQPLLVDKYYSAKGLSDMVLVVQNGQRSYPSRLACNGRTIPLDLRNPLKQALAATSLLVGGVVPPHITYSEAHQSALQDWLWSVGNHPWAHTSQGSEFNRLQIDTARRNMIVDSLTSSIETYNAAVQLLQEIRTEEANEEMQHQLALNDMSLLATQVNNLWKQVSAKVALLAFDDAMHFVDEAEQQADRLYHLALFTHSSMRAFQCLPHVVQDDDAQSQLLFVLPVIFIAFDVFLFFVLFICRTRGAPRSQNKAKVN